MTESNRMAGAQRRWRALRLAPLAPIAAAAIACAALPVLAADAMAGLVVRDPVTGALRAPTPEEFQALQAQQAQQKKDAAAAAAKDDAEAAAMRLRAVPQATQPQVELRANGSRKVVLGERGMSYSVISRKADGTLGAVQCVTGEQAAEVAVKGPTFGASVLTRGPAREAR